MADLPDIPESSEVMESTPDPRPRSRTLGRATAIMASGTFVSRGLGFVRTWLLTTAVAVNAFGANAFDVANRIPNAIYAVLAAGVFNSVLVPQIVKAFRRPDGKRTVDRIVTLGLAGSLLITIICTVAAPFVVRLYSSADWTDEQRSLATSFALLVIPQLFFYAAYTILGEVLNAREQFGPYMWAPVLNNIIGITGLGIYLAIYGSYRADADVASEWTASRILWLAIPATLAMVAQASILVWPLIRGGYRPRMVWGGPKGELSAFRVVAGWALAAVLVEQVGVTLAVRVASAADPKGDHPWIAGNAAYTVALMVYLVPHSLVTVSLLTALNTTMAKRWAAGDVDGTRDAVAQGLRITATFTSFATVALIVLAPMLARVALPTVTIDEVASVAWVIIALAFGMVPLGAMVLVKRAFFVLEDAKGIFWIHIPMTITWIAVSYLGMFVFTRQWWTAVVALGLSLSNVVGLTLRAGGLRRRLGGLGGRDVARVHWLSALAALVAFIVGMVMRVTVMQNLEQVSRSPIVFGSLQILMVGSVMAVVYIAMLKLTRVSEIETLISTVSRRLRRNVR